MVWSIASLHQLSQYNYSAKEKKKDTENSEEMGVPQPPGGISHHLANKKDSGKQWGKKDFVGIAW